MTDQYLNMAVAEACGIHVCHGCYHQIDPDVCHCGQYMKGHEYQDNHSGIPMGCTCGYVDALERKASAPECLNYGTDLNACASMEKSLTNSQLSVYCNTLRCLVEEQQPPGRAYIFTATAPQRREAFLRTIGKWVESKNDECLSVQREQGVDQK